jgi:hypothetical protein
MSLLWILVLVLLILAIAGAPTWPHSRGWGLGWFPSGGLLLVILILVILLATGRMGTL